ncbi:MAG: cytochrome C oxidase subunit IV family protein [Bacteroidetes bacterium]|nr:cytochrome C oxidase subunit IV family protein [Bacteroidota bacterium]
METNQATHDDAHSHNVGPSARKRLWNVFWLLLVITLVEVGLAFTPLNKDLLIALFFGFTLVKAYYIVAYFMHLKTETKEMGWMLIGPFIFIIYFIILMLYQGVALHHDFFGF